MFGIVHLLYQCVHGWMFKRGLGSLWMGIFDLAQSLNTM